MASAISNYNQVYANLALKGVIEKKYLKPIPALFDCTDPVAVPEEWQDEVRSCRPYCCFNHLIGLPTLKIKDAEGGMIEGKEMQILSYGRGIVNDIKKYTYYALNKARGIGATEMILRYILFLAITNTVPDRKFLIVPGIRLELAKDEIKRMKSMLRNIIMHVRGATDTTIWIGRSWIIALPANPAVIRGYENVEIVFLDESAHWNLNDDTPVLEAAEPHVSKSGAHIVVVSTPYGRRGFFSRIFHSEITTYFRKTLNYQVALGTLIDEKIIMAKKEEDPYFFEQEYDCQFITTRYAAIPIESIKAAEDMAEDYALEDLGFD